MQTPEPEKKNLFREIQRGDRRIRKAHRKAIILVGLTRIGKSTTFNWILKKPMKGKGKLISHYINSVDDESVARVGSSFSSVTLAPNVHINYQEGISLIDMAGYEDTRDYVGVIGVSYFLKALFEQVKQAKFVIVFDENKFFQQNASGLVRTFNGFINMFHYKEMSEDIKNKLKSSISVVITKSKREHEHFEYLDEVTQKLKHQELKIQNKDEVIDLLEYIRDSARVHPFKAAKDNCNPEECNFISNFSQKKGWNYFNVDEAQPVMKKSPISLPFNKDFNKLEQAQKLEFTNAIEKRVKSYVGFSQILRVLISNFTENWAQFINLWKQQRKAEPNYFKMKPTFEQIREFVDANDVYDSKESIQIKFRVNYEPMTLVKSIEEILSIFEFISKIGAPQGPETFEETMDLFSIQFSSIVQSLKGFASNNQDQELLQRLKYILIRGFRQFNKLYQLNEECIIDAKQNLRDNCNLVFEINQDEFVQKFVTELNSDLLTSIFPTLELLIEYEQFFINFETHYKGLKSKVFFNQQRCNIEMAKADLLVASGEKAKALLCYINALKSISEISLCVAQQQTQNKEFELNKLSMKKLKLVRKIVNILKILPENESNNYKRYALWLCQRHRMIQDSFQIYQEMIDSPSTSLIEKLRIYDDYAYQCAKWGNVDRGIQLLQKKLVLQEESFEDYCNTWAAIRNLAVNRDQCNKELIASLSETKRFPEADDELNMQLDEIKVFLQTC